MSRLLSEGKKLALGAVSVRVVLWSFLVFVLAAAGQTSLIVWLPRWLPEANRWYLAVVILAYWLLLAIVFAALIGRQINERLERPMRDLGEAAGRVAQGDFSVYVAPRHVEGTRQWNSTDQMFADFNTMVAELGSIETMKNDFVSNVSHEIKNPLAIITTHAKALERDTISDERRKAYVRTIVDASTRLNTLVTNTLKLNKLESQSIVAQAADYDVASQLTDAALALYDLFDAKGVALELDVEDHATVHADPGIVSLIWSNVLGNALKYTEPGGHVKLCQTSTSSEITVEIIDDGCGMSETEAARIFDKFYQGATAHAAEGNGLGMAMVKRAIDLSHGTISVRSSQGSGTTVTVTLPAAAGF
ncbi:histidine kinase [Bifidobacterium saguini DSM 23967]|uniref:Sensor-like histidine kinase SenX3 n=2 Tax=Bifidobacterium saguini TaxID=762210 RepID=A0A087DF58_9BIFI|nr:HAMP domain-containing sensor histidine kinase [Bifidobacterium saguini]KFI94158.1 histidine kinase [Bifidobacterium saguini DSM 23967]